MCYSVTNSDVDGWAHGGLRAGGTASRHILLGDFARLYSNPAELQTLRATYTQTEVSEGSMKESTRLGLNEAYEGLGDKVWTMLNMHA